MKKRLVLAATVFALVLMTSCALDGQTEIPPGEQTGNQESTAIASAEETAAAAVADAVKTDFTQEDFLEDYDQMWADLEAYYIFLPVLREAGLDIDEIYASGRERLEADATDLEGFMEVLDYTFGRMNYLAHLSLIDLSLYDRSISYYSPDYMNAWYETYQAAQTVATYGLLREKSQGVIGQDASKSTAAEAQPEETEGGESGAIDPTRASYLPEMKAAYFRFSSFAGELYETDKSLIKDFLESLGDKPVEHIIIDITGNGGGNTVNWLDGIVGVFGDEVSAETLIFAKDSAVTQKFIGEDNLYPLSELSEEEIPEFVEIMGLDCFWETRMGIAPAVDQENLVDADAKRWVLIDEGCYSAADQFAAFCKKTGWATLVGNRTRGDGVAGVTPAVIALKNTGLLVRFSIVAAANEDGTLNALVGTSPDYGCIRSETPFNACLRLIEAME